MAVGYMVREVDSEEEVGLFVTLEVQNSYVIYVGISKGKRESFRCDLGRKANPPRLRQVHSMFI